jgi:YVTN family beta-propeller protein
MRINYAASSELRKAKETLRSIMRKAIKPEGTRVYVVNNGNNSESAISTCCNTVVATVTVGTGPKGIAVNPANTRVYVANNLSNTVSVMDTTR